MGAGLLVCVASCALAACMYGCAPQAGAEGSGDGPASTATGSSETVAVDWSPSADCAICHVKEAESAEDGSCDASLHSTTTCSECHDDESQLAALHEGTTTSDRAPTRLKKTAVNEEFCLSCHAQDAIAAKSSGSTVLTDANGTTVNPHDLPVTATESHSEITCSDCHEMHSDKAGRAEDAQKLCRSCHHQDVYECYTCHQHG